jgi:hypothetical protein
MRREENLMKQKILAAIYKHHNQKVVHVKDLSVLAWEECQVL